jgi:hypothetical protein
MSISEIIRILENKIAYLQQQYTVLVNNGELERVVQVEQELNDLQVAVQKLKT